MTSDESFRKEDHLIKTKDFRDVYKAAVFAKKGPFFLYGRAGSGPRTRIGFSVSSRNVKLASRRNRLKRLFREAFRRDRINLKLPCDMVLVIKRDPGKPFQYEDAEKIFTSLTKDLKLR